MRCRARHFNNLIRCCHQKLSSCGRSSFCSFSIDSACFTQSVSLSSQVSPYSIYSYKRHASPYIPIVCACIFTLTDRSYPSPCWILPHHSSQAPELRAFRAEYPQVNAATNAARNPEIYPCMQSVTFSSHRQLECRIRIPQYGAIRCPATGLCSRSRGDSVVLNGDVITLLLHCRICSKNRILYPRFSQRKQVMKNTALGERNLAIAQIYSSGSGSAIWHECRNTHGSLNPLSPPPT